MLKRAMIVKVLGVILIILLIWFASDYIVWLEYTPNMLLAMAAPVGLLAMWETFKRVKASQANSKLTAAVVDQAKADQRPSGDVVQLRERFEEAVATLKQQKKRGGLGLYELPWYVIIGAPGSGKTTALKYSGLKFPLEQRSGRGALRGVGGTRNCDWWFTEEAVLLDTAGRYTTQDSDASADSAGWAEFLGLLKKYRKRRPLNGVLLAISAQDLMTQGHAGREAHVAAARRRLNELHKELRIQLPVYVLVTKCDLVAGFSEYFDDMSQDDRAQVLGVTFPQDVTLKGGAADAFPADFDAIVHRLNERVFARLEDERDARRRARIFGFPQQLASLRDSLTEYIGDIFESTRFDQKVLLRGVYFTSGTQEGTPIDRLLGALSRRFAAAAEPVAPSGRGKSYFIERLMKDVVLAESGLAGLSRRLELQKAVAQFALYVGMLAAGAILLLLMLYSYRTNQGFLSEFRVQALEVSKSLPPPGDSAITARPRLDAIRGLVDIAGGYADTSWFSRGWGLDQSGAIEEAAGDVYKDELSQALVRTVRLRLEQRLASLIGSGDPLDLYLTLRAYLMLKDTSADYFNASEVRDEALKEWGGNEDDIRRLDGHFTWLLEAGLPASEVNGDLVDRARSAIPPDAAPQLILADVKRAYERETQPAGQRTPVIDGQAFRTRSGRALGENLSAVFTKSGFEAADNLIKATETRFKSEEWVWGRRLPGSRDNRNEVWDLYETEYISEWKRVLDDIGLPQRSDELASYITRIAGEQQGLKALLQLVDRNTSLVPSVYEKAPATLLGSPIAFVQGEMRSAALKLKRQDAEHGTRITVEFIPVHRLVTPIGDKVWIDDLVARMKDVGAQLEKTKPGTVGGSGGGVAIADLQKAAKDLQSTASGLPGPAASISSFAAAFAKAAQSESGGQLLAAIRVPYDNFLKACRDTINDRYPFFKTTADVGPQDFERLLGGALGELKAGLADYAEKRGGVWVAKQLSGEPLPIGHILEKLNAAERIRDAFFPTGQPRFRFMIDVRELDERSLKFELNENLFEDGRRLTFENARINPKWAVWPTPKPGDVTAAFTVDNTGRVLTPRGEGHWNWFRLMEDYGVLDKQTDTAFLLTIKQGQFWARIRLTTESALNPFNIWPSLRTFRCGG